MAEVLLLERMWRRGLGTSAGWPATLREDFGGTCSVAAAWCASDPARDAVAIERHPPTARWAQRRHHDAIANGSLHIVQSDVMAFAGPKVDVVCALNFSACEWHTRTQLLAYLKHARRCLNAHGIVALNTYGGPTSETPSTQHRRFTQNGSVMRYTWEQQSFDPITRRARNAIHFEHGPRSQRQQVRNAFTYRWRLWTLPELADAMTQARLTPTVWMSSPTKGYRPVTQAPNTTTDWVAYITARPT